MLSNYMKIQQIELLPGVKLAVSMSRLRQVAWHGKDEGGRRGQGLHAVCCKARLLRKKPPPLHPWEEGGPDQESRYVLIESAMVVKICRKTVSSFSSRVTRRPCSSVAKELSGTVQTPVAPSM